MASNSTNIRTIWLVRHAEREDTINPKWLKNANPNGLKLDNTPLSARGRAQAEELAKRFSTVKIDHIFASPFERTMETASILVGKRKIPIKPEKGLLEPLIVDPPGYQDPVTLKRRFPLTDVAYESVHQRPFHWERRKEWWRKQAIETFMKIICDERYRDAKTFVFVAHSSTLAAIHLLLANQEIFIDVATVSKFVLGDGQIKMKFAGDFSHISEKNRKNLQGPYIRSIYSPTDWGKCCEIMAGIYVALLTVLIFGAFLLFYYWGMREIVLQK